MWDLYIDELEKDDQLASTDVQVVQRTSPEAAGSPSATPPVAEKELDDFLVDVTLDAFVQFELEQRLKVRAARLAAGNDGAVLDESGGGSSSLSSNTNTNTNTSAKP